MPDLPEWPGGAPAVPPALYATKLDVHGHSWTVGGGATGNHGYVQKLAALLKIPTTTGGGVGGAQASSPQGGSGPGGYAKAYADLPAASGAAPYLPRQSIAVVQYGLLDVAQFGSAALSPFKGALRAIISRERAAPAGIFEETHASVVTTSWTSPGAPYSTDSSGGSCVLGGNGTVTISVPADFPGGTVTLGFLTATGLTNTGTATVTIDGNPGPGLAFAPYTITNGNGDSAVVLRLPNLAAGAHTVVITAAASYVMFDYWQIEALAPPIVICPTQPRLPAAGYATLSGFPHQPGDADIVLLNQAIQQVVAEFDQNVICPDFDALFAKNPAYYSTAAPPVGGAHPNDLGHSVAAAACLQALQAVSNPAALQAQAASA